MITYALENEPEPDEVRALWISSGYIDYSPGFDWDQLPRMLAHSNLMVVARHRGRMVGMTRAATDFALYCGLIDMIVDSEYRRQGIGRELILRTRAAAGENVWMTILAPSSLDDFYGKAGCTRVQDGWSAWVLMPPKASVSDPNPPLNSK